MTNPSTSVINAELEQQAVGLLIRRLLVHEPDRIVLIGQWPVDLQWEESDLADLPLIQTDSLSAFNGQNDSVRFDQLAGSTPPVDSATVAEGTDVALMALDCQSGHADELLGQAVRQFPACLIIHTVNEHLPEATFFAFGFRRLDVIVSKSSEQHRWYEYSLSDYKQAPDWLNARFWANPERFGLDDESDAQLDWESDDDDEE